MQFQEWLRYLAENSARNRSAGKRKASPGTWWERWFGVLPGLLLRLLALVRRFRHGTMIK
ncbi:hypothetical protein [Pasteuria penetrans]|uniref:hypothetical protein n=1 Tax=Pasteuria penetrans TaxID=86005 RepID=UPI0011F075FD|nr:hypothetical protein [Pasteuria penetrans]